MVRAIGSVKMAIMARSLCCGRVSQTIAEESLDDKSEFLSMCTNNYVTQMKQICLMKKDELALLFINLSNQTSFTLDISSSTNKDYPIEDSETYTKKTGFIHGLHMGIFLDRK